MHCLQDTPPPSQRGQEVPTSPLLPRAFKKGCIRTLSPPKHHLPKVFQPPAPSPGERVPPRPHGLDPRLTWPTTYKVLTASVHTLYFYCNATLLFPSLTRVLTNSHTHTPEKNLTPPPPPPHTHTPHTHTHHCHARACTHTVTHTVARAHTHTHTHAHTNLCSQPRCCPGNPVSFGARAVSTEPRGFERCTLKSENQGGL
jgi:hypothetical protein